MELQQQQQQCLQEDEPIGGIIENGPAENRLTKQRRSKALRNFTYRQRHREQIARQRRQYELKNREELARKRHERYLVVREKAIEKKHEYYKKNRDAILAQKRATYDKEARLDYYNKNRDRILAHHKATYDREEATQRHRAWRDRVYSDPERAAIYRKKRRESVIRSLGKKAGVFLLEKGRSAPMLGTGYVPSLEYFIRDPERAIVAAYKNFDVFSIFRTAERREGGKHPRIDLDGLPVNEAIAEARADQRRAVAP